MSDHNEKPNNEKKPMSPMEALQALFESFNRSEITLPKAIIIAAILIALALMFS